MNEILSSEDLVERIELLIEYLTEHEDVYYVALDVAHQLSDEVMRAVEEHDVE